MLQFFEQLFLIKRFFLNYYLLFKQSLLGLLKKKTQLLGVILALGATIAVFLGIESAATNEENWVSAFTKNTNLTQQYFNIRTTTDSIYNYGDNNFSDLFTNESEDNYNFTIFKNLFVNYKEFFDFSNGPVFDNQNIQIGNQDVYLKDSSFVNEENVLDALNFDFRGYADYFNSNQSYYKFIFNPEHEDVSDYQVNKNAGDNTGIQLSNTPNVEADNELSYNALVSSNYAKKYKIGVGSLFRVNNIPILFKMVGYAQTPDDYGLISRSFAVLSKRHGYSFVVPQVIGSRLQKINAALSNFVDKPIDCVLMGYDKNALQAVLNTWFRNRFQSFSAQFNTKFTISLKSMLELFFSTYLYEASDSGAEAQSDVNGFYLPNNEENEGDAQTMFNHLRSLNYLLNASGHLNSFGSSLDSTDPQIITNSNSFSSAYYPSAAIFNYVGKIKYLQIISITLFILTIIFISVFCLFLIWSDLWFNRKRYAVLKANGYSRRYLISTLYSFPLVFSTGALLLGFGLAWLINYFVADLISTNLLIPNESPTLIWWQVLAAFAFVFTFIMGLTSIFGYFFLNTSPVKLLQPTGGQKSGSIFLRTASIIFKPLPFSLKYGVLHAVGQYKFFIFLAFIFFINAILLALIFIIPTYSNQIAGNFFDTNAKGVYQLSARENSNRIKNLTYDTDTGTEQTIPFSNLRFINANGDISNWYNQNSGDDQLVLETPENGTENVLTEENQRMLGVFFADSNFSNVENAFSPINNFINRQNFVNFANQFWLDAGYSDSGIATRFAAIISYAESSDFSDVDRLANSNWIGQLANFYSNTRDLHLNKGFYLYDQSNQAPFSAVNIEAQGFSRDTLRPITNYIANFKYDTTFFSDNFTLANRTFGVGIGNWRRLQNSEIKERVLNNITNYQLPAIISNSIENISRSNNIAIDANALIKQRFRVLANLFRVSNPELAQYIQDNFLASNVLYTFYQVANSRTSIRSNSVFTNSQWLRYFLASQLPDNTNTNQLLNSYFYGGLAYVNSTRTLYSQMAFPGYALEDATIGSGLTSTINDSLAFGEYQNLSFTLENIRNFLNTILLVMYVFLGTFVIIFFSLVTSVLSIFIFKNSHYIAILKANGYSSRRITGFLILPYLAVILMTTIVAIPLITFVNETLVSQVNKFGASTGTPTINNISVAPYLILTCLIVTFLVFLIYYFCYALIKLTKVRTANESS